LAGFGPSAANEFRKMISIEQIAWEERRVAYLPVD
jgi:hypothetical protein